MGASAKLGLYSGGLSERPMEPVLKTGGQKCLVGSNPTPSATVSLAAPATRAENAAHRRMRIALAVMTPARMSVLPTLMNLPECTRSTVTVVR